MIASRRQLIFMVQYAAAPPQPATLRLVVLDLATKSLKPLGYQVCCARWHPHHQIPVVRCSLDSLCLVLLCFLLSRVRWDAVRDPLHRYQTLHGTPGSFDRDRNTTPGCVTCTHRDSMRLRVSSHGQCCSCVFPGHRFVGLCCGAGVGGWSPSPCLCRVLCHWCASLVRGVCGFVPLSRMWVDVRLVVAVPCGPGKAVCAPVSPLRDDETDKSLVHLCVVGANEYLAVCGPDVRSPIRREEAVTPRISPSWPLHSMFCCCALLMLVRVMCDCGRPRCCTCIACWTRPRHRLAKRSTKSAPPTHVPMLSRRNNECVD